MWYHEVVAAGRLPDRRHVVADRDRRDHDHAACPASRRRSRAPPRCPFFGVDAAIVDREGKESPHNQGGLLVIRKPWPSMLRGIFNDPERYKKTYWSRRPGMYFTGDGARRDDDGYFWIMGRHRRRAQRQRPPPGTAEIESALVSHPSVAEARSSACRTR
jgi:acetyl-CoA synthetase